MEKKISIIVPIYNSEKYLERCIKSILNQTYKHLELIAVNDGSTDKTLEILNVLQNNDQRLKIISQQNSGVSVARNRGIKEATGEYILFIDSDDWIENDYVEILINTCEVNNLDICRTSFFVDRENGLNEKIGFSELKSSIIDVKDIETNFIKSSLFHSACVQMIKLDIIKKNDVFFNEKIIYEEDLLFNFEVFKKSHKVMYIDCCKYHYTANDESATRNLKNVYKIINSIIVVNNALISETKVYGDYETEINTKHLKVILMYLWQLLRFSYRDFTLCIKRIDNCALSLIFKNYDKKLLSKKLKIKKIIISLVIKFLE